MRGLAFPSSTPADREASYEYGTPISSSNVDDIPIDPALEPPIDPALMMDATETNEMQAPVPVPPVLPEDHYGRPPPPPGGDYHVPQYSGGPQGDPFAPQVPVPFFAPPAPPPKPRRRKRVTREEDCSFCRGNVKNKRGELESMITCFECGRSGHPSCMQLEKLADVVRSYPWKCIECKNCEVCQEKGDDERILFCDCCDRGWHMDCVDPPIQSPPEGDWRCPFCNDPLTPEEAMFAQPYPQSEHAPVSPATSIPEGSVASTSRSTADAPTRTTAPSKARKTKKSTASKGRTRGVAKGATVPVVLSDGSDHDDPVDITDSPVTARGKRRPSRPSAKARARQTASSDDDDGVIEVRPSRTAAATAAATAKRKRPREEPDVVTPRVKLRLAMPRGAKGKEREEDEQTSPYGLFDDILGPDDRDVSKTTPMNADKLAFERSRVIAEEKLAPPPPSAVPPTASSSRAAETQHNHHHPEPATPLTSGRPLRSAVLAQLSAAAPKVPSFAHSPAPSTPGPPPLSRFEPGVLRIRTIRFGPYDIRTWYDAPFPEEYASIPDGRLWICEFCLKYMKSRYKAIRHQMKCKMRHPPGDEIYRDGVVSIFEVDGRRNKIYCQNLCLLSKMFLDHKSLFYDVEPFLFYVITQVDDFGARFVGYFSKEKRCPKEYNLSCIMTLPVRQRQGWGNLLIDFSYLLSKIEQRLGSPEKPLSSLGALGYKNYWTLAVMRFLEHAPDNVRLEEISSATSMTLEDVCTTLAQQGLIYIRDATPPPVRPSPGQSIRYPKGRKHGAAATSSSARKHLQRMRSMSMSASMSPSRGGGANGHAANGHGADGKESAPFVVPAHYEIRFDRAKAAAYVRAWEAKGYLRLRPEKLQWTPYLVQRNERWGESLKEKELPAVDNVVVDVGEKEAEKVKEVEGGKGEIEEKEIEKEDKREEEEEEEPEEPEQEKEDKQEEVQAVEHETIQEVEHEEMQEVEPEKIQEVEPEKIQEVEQEQMQEVEPETIQEVEQEEMQEVEQEKVQEPEHEEKEEEEAEEPADSAVFLNGHIPGPVTPKITMNGGSMEVDTPLGDSGGDKDELPMLVDSPVAETRRPRGRPPGSSKEKGKEKENTRELRTPKVVSPATTPEPVPQRRTTRSGQVRVPEPSLSVKPKAGPGRGRGRPPKKKVEPVEEEVVVETRQLRSETKRAASARGVGTRKRRRIESSPEAEAGAEEQEEQQVEVEEQVVKEEPGKPDEAAVCSARSSCGSEDAEGSVDEEYSGM